MGIFRRLDQNLRQAFSRGPRIEDVESAIDEGLQKGDIVPARLAEAISNPLEEVLKGVDEAEVKSHLDIRRASNDVGFFYQMLHRAVKRGDLPPQGDPMADFVLADYWKHEPILAGAVYSMTAKIGALTWTVTGQKRMAMNTAKMLGRAASMEGYDWGGFIVSSSQDFYTTNRGVFWDVNRADEDRFDDLELYLRPVADIGHIDALCCALTGNSKKPMIYQSVVTGQKRWFRPGEFIHFASMVSPREEHTGIGFCASARAWRAAKLLTGLHDYDEEKLNNLPPEGVAAVTGLTLNEFKDALAFWKSARKANNSLTFPQVLWLLAGQSNTKVELEFIGFSQLPESFNREVVIDQYVNTLALVFGVDAREFWPISTSSMGTAAESEIQHLKAKGKGPGELITTIERKINAELPDGAVFAFDTQDSGEDKVASEIAKGWVDALLPLTAAGGATEDILTKEQLLRLLADKRVIPNWMVPDERSVVTDSAIQEKTWRELDDSDGDPIVITYKEGLLTADRLPTYQILAPESRQTNVSVPVAIAVPKNGEVSVYDPLVELKALADKILVEHRNIVGDPIPDKETARGGNVTRNAIKAEIERWRNHPELAQYVPTSDSDLEEILQTVKSMING
jgi:hypothetical protein